MKRPSEASNKRDLLEKGRGWADALDWFLDAEPTADQVHETLSRLAEWNPTELKGKLYRQGQMEALEWLRGG